MFGGGSITLFHIRGIRIAVDWSWFLILFLVIFWMTNFYSDLLGDSGYAAEFEAGQAMTWDEAVAFASRRGISA